MLSHIGNGYKTTITTADANGEFAFEHVPFGKHHFFALAGDMASRHERYQGESVTTFTIDPPTEPIVLKMKPAPSIRVHVAAKDGGAPIAGAAREARLDRHQRRLEE